MAPLITFNRMQGAKLPCAKQEDRNRTDPATCTSAVLLCSERDRGSVINPHGE